MILSRLHFAFIVGVITSSLSLFSGCGDDPNAIYPVSGKIVFSDKSNARFGNIEFRSESDEPIVARGKINQDGTFRLKSLGGKSGTVAGWHKVVIFQIIDNFRNSSPVVHKHGLEVAEKYRSYQTTPLRVEVQPDGKNNFVLEVEEKSSSN